MKITSFNPQIITKDAQQTIKLFEELGFVQTHNKAEDVDVKFSAHRMKNEVGFHIDILEVPSIPKEITTIRINVDDYDEAYELLTSKGFKESENFPPSNTASSKYAYLVSPSGAIIGLCLHIKK